MSEKEKQDGWAAFGKFLAGLLMYPVAMVVVGLVVSVLWGWFIAPVFHLPVLSIPHAMGLGLFLGYCCKATDMRDKDGHSKPFGEQVLYAVVATLLLMLMAWIVHLFC